MATKPKLTPGKAALAKAAKKQPQKDGLAKYAKTLRAGKFK
jgi:hypothetical protein